MTWLLEKTLAEFGQQNVFRALLLARAGAALVAVGRYAGEDLGRHRAGEWSRPSALVALPAWLHARRWYGASALRPRVAARVGTPRTAPRRKAPGAQWSLRRNALAPIFATGSRQERRGDATKFTQVAVAPLEQVVWRSGSSRPAGSANFGWRLTESNRRAALSASATRPPIASRLPPPIGAR